MVPYFWWSLSSFQRPPKRIMVFVLRNHLQEWFYLEKTLQLFPSGIRKGEDPGRLSFLSLPCCSLWIGRYSLADKQHCPADPVETYTRLVLRGLVCKWYNEGYIYFTSTSNTIVFLINGIGPGCCLNFRFEWKIYVKCEGTSNWYYMKWTILFLAIFCLQQS